MNLMATHCERCSSAIEADDLRCPVCNLSCPASKQEDRQEAAVDILRCSSCGAAMTYEVKKRAAACAFCGSVLELEHPADPVEEAQFLLPFSIDRDRARAAFREWLGSLGWFRPGDLISGARLETIQPLRWVGWVFDARAELSWAADTDHDARRADWAPHAGRAELDYDDVVVPATRGLTPQEAAHLVESYDLDTRATTTSSTMPPLSDSTSHGPTPGRSSSKPLSSSLDAASKSNTSPAGERATSKRRRCCAVSRPAATPFLPGCWPTATKNDCSARCSLARMPPVSWARRPTPPFGSLPSWRGRWQPFSHCWRSSLPDPRGSGFGSGRFSIPESVSSLATPT